MSTTALDLIKTAFNLVGVYAPGETPDAADAQNALGFLNGMMGQWSLQSGTIPYRARSVFTMVSGQGGPTNPYTMGTGGDLNVPRPMRLDGAGLLLTQSQPQPVEIPLSLYTDDGYEAIQVKDLSNNQPVGVWYQPTSPWANVFLWPVPNVNYNELVLYYLAQLSSFADLATAYVTPAGYDEAIAYNLARRLSTPYGKPCPPDVTEMAALSLMVIKRPNFRFNDLPQDIPIGNRQYGYNINTGNM